MKLNIKFLLIVLVILGVAFGYFLYNSWIIKIPPCFVLKEVSTYSDAIDEEKARSIVQNYLKDKSYSFLPSDLTVQNVEGTIRVFLSISNITETPLCNTYESEPKCIGPWYDIKNGKVYESQLNPC